MHKISMSNNSNHGNSNSDNNNDDNNNSGNNGWRCRRIYHNYPIRKVEYNWTDIE